MFTLDVRADFSKQIAMLNDLKKNLGDKVVARALNDTANKAKTAIAANIATTYNLPSATIKEGLSVKPATARGLQLTATLFGRPLNDRRRALNVIHFLSSKATVKAWKKQTGGRPQLMFKITKAGAAKPIAGAFVGNQGRTVFRRIGTGRLPIEPVRTIGVPQMFQARRIQEPVQNAIPSWFAERFEHHMRYLLSTLK